MIDPVSPPGPIAANATTGPKPASPEAMNAAREFEQVFLTEMLKHAGLGKASTFGGGIGEEQFQSFLVGEQARALVEAGGIGLAEVIARNLEVKHGT